MSRTNSITDQKPAGIPCPARVSHVLKFALLSAALALVPVVLSAQSQSLPLKPPPPANTSIATCSVEGLVPGAAVVAPAVIDSLIDAGMVAGLRGQHEEARLLFRQASFLDPSNQLVPYRLAVTLEALGDAEGAISEYCRYIALNPAGDDVEQTRQRIRELSDRAGADATAWRTAAANGVTAFRAGMHSDAARAFGRVVELRPNDPEGYYNRGISLLAAGDGAAGVADLKRYLELAPNAGDRPLVERYLENLPPITAAEDSTAIPVGSGNGSNGVLATGGATAGSAQPPPGVPLLPAPGSVLLRGLLIPGLGQLTTGRPALGVMVLGAAVGSAAYGLIEKTVIERRSGTDPFGNRYEYDAEVPGRPNLKVGLAAAGGIALIGALEGYLHTRGEWARLTVAPGTNVIGLSIAVPTP